MSAGRRTVPAWVVVVGVTACHGSSAGVQVPPGLAPAPAVHVQGNRLVDSGGRPVRLRGVNRSGAEYACAQGWGIFDGPSDSASVSAIASWRTNVVRLPLNETCWLGINGLTPAYAGANYQQAIADYVTRLNRAGLVVILDLHWTAADTAKALAQAPMPNRDHTPEFWRQVATAYGHNNAVIFDLFNEPFPDSNADTPEAWRCWRDGGTCRGMSFQAAGMQELLGRPGRAGRPTRPAGAGRAGAERPRPDVRRLADGLDGRPQRQLSRVDLGRVELGLGPHHELRRHAHAVRGNVPSPLCLVAPPLRSPRCCSPAMRVDRPSRVGRRRSIPAP